MAEGEVVIEVKLDDGSYRKAWINLEKDSKEAGQRSGDNITSGVEAGFGSVLKKVAAVTAAYLSLRELTQKVGEGIRAAISSENAFQQLNLALAQNGHFTQEASDHLSTYINELEELTAVSDDVIAKGAAMLAGLGKLSGDGLDRATKAALDLAAGLQKGPEEAFEIMAKAAEGNVMALNKFGFHLTQTGDKATDFARTMEAVNSRFGGMAEGKLNTFGGAIEKLGVSFDNFLKNIGFAFTQSAILKDVIKTLSDFFTTLGKGVSAMSENGNVLDGLILKSLELGLVITKYVVPPFELLYNVGTTVFNALRTGIQFAVVTIAQTMLGLVEPIAAVTGKFGGLRDGLRDFVSSSETVLVDFAGKTAESMDKIFDFGTTEAIEQKIALYQSAAQRIVDTHVSATDAIVNSSQKIQANSLWQRMGVEFKAFATDLEAVGHKVDELAKSMVNTIRGGLANGLTNAFANVGKALVSGANVFEAFGQTILSTFGGILVQLGQQIIAAGVGLLLTGVFAGNGLAMIAGGAAIAVAGGILQALASGGGDNGAGATGNAAPGGLGSGGGVAVSPVGAELTSPAGGESAKPGTQLVVNIQGNVLDRQSTGLEIANILRENFELHGITFAGNAAT